MFFFIKNFHCTQKLLCYICHSRKLPRSYLNVVCVMFRHSKWSRLSPQPPLPFRNFVFFVTLGIVNVILLGYNWPAFVAICITCWTLEITWLDSQLFFLWWTPLKLFLQILSKNKNDKKKDFFLPFSDMEYTWTFHNHRIQLIF